MLSFSLSSSPSLTTTTTSLNLAGKHSYLPPESVKFRRPSSISVAATASSPETAANSLYEVLQISIGASNEEIKSAYRRLVRSCHPDVTIRGERKSADEFMRVHAAYSVLSDPEKRADYDRKLSRILRPPESRFPGLSASPTSSFCRFTRRNWESDQCW